MHYCFVTRGVMTCSRSLVNFLRNLEKNHCIAYLSWDVNLIFLAMNWRSTSSVEYGVHFARIVSCFYRSQKVTTELECNCDIELYWIQFITNKIIESRASGKVWKYHQRLVIIHQ